MTSNKSVKKSLKVGAMNKTRKTNTKSKTPVKKGTKTDKNSKGIDKKSVTKKGIKKKSTKQKSLTTM